MKKEKEKKVKEKKVKEKAVSEPKPEGRVREFLRGAVFSLMVGVGAVDIALIGMLIYFLNAAPRVPTASTVPTSAATGTIAQSQNSMSLSSLIFGAHSQTQPTPLPEQTKTGPTSVPQNAEAPGESVPLDGDNSQQSDQEQNPSSQTQANGNNQSESSSQIPAQSKPSENSGGNNGNADNFNTYDNSDQQKTEASYVLNTNSRKFHYPSCNDVKKIAPQNYETFEGTRDEAINAGYSPCGHCNP